MTIPLELRRAGLSTIAEYIVLAGNDNQFVIAKWKILHHLGPTILIYKPGRDRWTDGNA